MDFFQLRGLNIKSIGEVINMKSVDVLVCKNVVFILK